ncbi:hypothetical protein KKF61_08120 [Patescibacteria group bacterium]|nr:hypothetical protein [Patescibacteria group bacterium]
MSWRIKPYWSWGNLLHAGWGIVATLFGGLNFGDSGAAGMFVLVTIGGCMWEILNQRWPKGDWMFSDLIGFLFFPAGGLLAGAVYLLWLR